MDDADFRQKLTPEQYRVMRQKGTETAHTGKYWDHDEAGAYCCGACGNILFLSLNKVESEDGWPLFTRPARAHAVALTPEDSGTEVSCARCGSHIGYRIGEKEYRVNSIALDFQELPDIDWDMDDGSDNSQQSQSPSQTKTLTLTIGGITLGAVLGAGAVWAATPPQTMCPLLAPLQATSSQPTGNTLPRATGTTRPAPAAGSALPAQSATLATSSAATSSAAATPGAANSSAATTTP